MFFSRTFSDRTRLAFVTAAAVGAGTAVFFIWWWWTKKQKPQPPSKWRKVGELSDIMVFPIKSLAPIRMTEMECTILGLKSGWLRDRTLLVIDLEGRFITGRQLPKMVNVREATKFSLFFYIIIFYNSFNYSVIILCAIYMRNKLSIQFIT